jgi:hypothetical protein
MRTLCLTTLLCIILQNNTFLLAQQSTINGTVTIQNSGYANKGVIQYVQNAQVEDNFRRANPATTDDKGRFNLTFVGIKTSESVEISIRKEGLEVVNRDALNAVAGQAKQLRIYMAKPSEVDNFRLKIYGIGKTAAEKELDKKLKQNEIALLSLRNQANIDQKSINALEKTKEELIRRYQSLDQQAQELAKKYAAINLDDVTPIVQEAFNYFQKGDLDAALAVFKAAQLDKKGEAILLDRDKTQNLAQEVENRIANNNEQTRQLIEAYSFEADMLTMKWAFKQVDSVYQSMLKFNATNATIYKEYGSFLIRMSEVSKAILVYKKGLTYAQKPIERIELMMNLGEAQRQKEQFSDADSLLLAAIQLSEPFRVNEKEVFDPIWATAQHYLGNVLNDKKMFGEAEIAYNNALKIREERAMRPKATSTDSFLLATNLRDIAANYRRQRNYINGAKCFERGLMLYDKIAQSNTFHKRGLAALKNNYGNFLVDIDSVPKAIVAFSEAAAIYKSFMAHNKTAFEGNYLRASFGLGRAYLTDKKYDKALIILNEVVTIKSARAIKDSLEYDNDLITMLNTLAILNGDLNNYAAAHANYDTIVKIQKRLVKNTTQYNEAEICLSYFNRGALYQKQEKYDLAEHWYLEAVKGRREWANKSPDGYGENHQGTLLPLINLYDAMRLNEQNEQKIKLWTNNQAKYRHEMVELQIKIINAYEKAVVNGKHAKLSEAYAHLAMYYLSINKKKEAEIAAKKQDAHTAYFFMFLYLIQDKYKEAQSVLAEIMDKKAAKTYCSEWADGYFNQKIINNNTRNKINNWFETTDVITLMRH